jgi:hypothetical protein
MLAMVLLLAAPTTDDGCGPVPDAAGPVLVLRLLPPKAATAGLAARGHHRQPAASVIETGQRLVNTGDDWGQDLRTLVAAAVAGLVLVPAAIVAFRAATR